jgi:quinol-cytochrome oxidoreductase complex cytochrome b subunit
MAHNANAPQIDFGNPVINWIDRRLPVFTLMQKEYGSFPTPRNFNYLWNFGAIAMVMLFIMIGSGIILAMHYTADVKLSFNAVERIMRDVNYGWLLRYMHSNGASFFFVAVYVHLFRGLYYGSYKEPRELLWILGALILFLMIATAFMGYVLPWGQMSFWAATVITNLMSAFPLIGDPLVTWLWGGFAVDNPTLTRFFALHYLLPFVILGVVFLHVAALHVCGSNNPLGIEPKSDKDTIPFNPYYTVKDMFGLSIFLMAYAAFVFWMPDALGHPDNYIPADPMVTPPHIVPEWYFLPYYAILRSFTIDIAIPFTNIILISSKLGGVILMLLSIAVLFVLPWLDKSPVRSARFRPLYRIFFWILLAVCLLLGYLGSKPPEGWYTIAAQVATAYYFAHFFIILPLLPKIEKCKPLPSSIHEAVTKKPQ